MTIAAKFIASFIKKKKKADTLHWVTIGAHSNTKSLTVRSYVAMYKRLPHLKGDKK